MEAEFSVSVKQSKGQSGVKLAEILLIPTKGSSDIRMTITSKDLFLCGYFNHKSIHLFPCNSSA